MEIFNRAPQITTGVFVAALVIATLAQARAQDAAQADPHAGHQMPATEKKAESPPAQDHSQMAGMPGMHHGANMNEPEMYLMGIASGTSMNPQSWPMPMLMPKLGTWSLMIMGQAYVIDTQQSGPRGGDKFYSPNWGMLSAEHRLGKGSFMLQSTFSLEPATISHSFP